MMCVLCGWNVSRGSTSSVRMLHIAYALVLRALFIERVLYGCIRRAVFAFGKTAHIWSAARSMFILESAANFVDLCAKWPTITISATGLIG